MYKEHVYLQYWTYLFSTAAGLDSKCGLQTELKIEALSAEILMVRPASKAANRRLHEFLSLLLTSAATNGEQISAGKTESD